MWRVFGIHINTQTFLTVPDIACLLSYVQVPGTRYMIFSLLPCPEGTKRLDVASVVLGPCWKQGLVAEDKEGEGEDGGRSQ